MINNNNKIKYSFLLKKAVFMLTIIGFSFSFWKEKPADAAHGPRFPVVQPGTYATNGESSTQLSNPDQNFYSLGVRFYSSGDWSYSLEWSKNKKTLFRYQKQIFFQQNKEFLEKDIQDNKLFFERLMNQTVTDFTDAILFSYTKENPNFMGMMLWNGIHQGSIEQLKNLNSQLKEARCLIKKWLNSGAGGESLLPEEKKKIDKLVIKAFTTGKGYLKEARDNNNKPKLLTRKEQKEQEKQKEHEHKQLCYHLLHKK